MRKVSHAMTKQIFPKLISDKITLTCWDSPPGYIKLFYMALLAFDVIKAESLFRLGSRYKLICLMPVDMLRNT